jgi:DNA repair protein RecN (Recombination protein N)
MLHELRAENLLLMERAELRLAPGLNVVTGETGAGKTLLAHALDLLLGGRARRGIVRQGAAEAYVEGVFALPDALRGAELVADDAEELVLARRVWPDGRTRAYVCGRSATVADLQELGGALLAFYGQHEHRKLMLAATQLDVLDSYVGGDQLRLRTQVGDAHARARVLEARVEELAALAGARDRELDLLQFELDEIEAVAPSAEEQTALTGELQRLQHLETLREAAAGGAEVIAPEGDRASGADAGAGAGVGELLAGALGPLERAAAIDRELGPLHERLVALQYEAQDLGAELRRYALAIDVGPGRLDEVQERLALFARLERKHGGTIADVLEHAERCRVRRDELEHADVSLSAAEDELAAAREQLEQLSASLGAARRKRAPALARAVRERLAELAMPDAEFSVQIEARADGCGPRGADAVELLIAPNPGMPAGPLREIASGGELSRVMLALLSVAHAGGAVPATPLLVFDEIDAGIGGHTARAVGEHLRTLAADRQILCITHLPQVASMAERHFQIVKDAGGGAARTAVTQLDGEEVVSELVRMLGAGEGDRAAGEHARALLRAA